MAVASFPVFVTLAHGAANNRCSNGGDSESICITTSSYANYGRNERPRRSRRVYLSRYAKQVPSTLAALGSAPILYAHRMAGAVASGLELSFQVGNMIMRAVSYWGSMLLVVIVQNRFVPVGTTLFAMVSMVEAVEGP